MNFLIVNEKGNALTVVNTIEDAREERERLQEYIDKHIGINDTLRIVKVTTTESVE
jgi:hypothetical protein